MTDQVHQDMEEDQVFEFNQFARDRRNHDIEASCNNAIGQLSREIQNIHADIVAKRIEVQRVEAELVVMQEQKDAKERKLRASRRYLSELYGGE